MLSSTFFWLKAQESWWHEAIALLQSYSYDYLPSIPLLVRMLTLVHLHSLLHRNNGSCFKTGRFFFLEPKIDGIFGAPWRSFLDDFLLRSVQKIYTNTYCDFPEKNASVFLTTRNTFLSYNDNRQFLKVF